MKTYTSAIHYQHLRYHHKTTSSWPTTAQLLFTSLITAALRGIKTMSLLFISHPNQIRPNQKKTEHTNPIIKDRRKCSCLYSQGHEKPGMFTVTRIQVKPCSGGKLACCTGSSNSAFAYLWCRLCALLWCKVMQIQWWCVAKDCRADP